MRNNRFVVVIFITVLMLWSLAFTALPHDTMPISPVLPDWAIMLLNIAFTWLITNGLKSLSKTLPWVPTLQGQATSLVAALVGFAVIFGNGLLAMIPPTYAPGVTMLFVFIGTLLSAYGLHATVTMFTPKIDEKALSQPGQGMVEYALILVLVAVVVIVALSVMGPLVQNIFKTVNANL